MDAVPAIAVAAASASLLGSLVICVAFLASKALKTPQLTMVFFMSLCDVAWSGSLLGMFAPGLASTGRLTENTRMCQVLGGVLQFAAVGSLSWYFLLCVSLWRVFWLGKTAPRSRTCSRRLCSGPVPRVGVQHLFVWSIAAVATGAPIALAAGSSAFGRLSTGTCWLVGHPHDAGVDVRASFYALLVLYLAAAAGLLAFLVACGGRRRLLALRNGRALASRMLAFTGVFLVVWSAFSLERVWVWLGVGEAPPSLVYVHVAALALNGLANSVVWGTTPAFQRTLCRRSVRGSEAKELLNPASKHVRVRSPGSVLSPSSGHPHDHSTVASGYSSASHSNGPSPLAPMEPAPFPSLYGTMTMSPRSQGPVAALATDSPLRRGRAATAGASVNAGVPRTPPAAWPATSDLLHTRSLLGTPTSFASTRSPFSDGREWAALEERPRGSTASRLVGELFPPDAAGGDAELRAALSGGAVVADFADTAYGARAQLASPGVDGAVRAAAMCSPVGPARPWSPYDMDAPAAVARHSSSRRGVAGVSVGVGVARASSSSARLSARGGAGQTHGSLPASSVGMGSRSGSYARLSHGSRGLSLGTGTVHLRGDIQPNPVPSAADLRLMHAYV